MRYIIAVVAVVMLFVLGVFWLRRVGKEAFMPANGTEDNPRSKGASRKK